LEFELF